jgi:glucosamine--fructose-6-phosphate aminotransferase (isomerizing)
VGFYFFQLSLLITQFYLIFAGMCGIVGYIGDKQAYPIIIKGLKRLEYRGYDSAGIAILDNETYLYKKK